MCIGLALFVSACAREPRRVEANPELWRLFEADQADRRVGDGHIDWKAVTPRDEERRRRTAEILSMGGAQVAEDFYCAAMVFQHGAGEEDFRQARHLALRAVELRPEYGAARWLAAAALDREQM